MDLIEHYARCPALRRIFNHYGCKHGSCGLFFGLDFDYPDRTLIRHCEVLHAIYTSYHTIVHNPSMDGLALLKHKCKETVGF